MAEDAVEEEELDIDFSRLRREFAQAKEKDERYWRENDAKFRAVNQRVASYEEFRYAHVNRQLFHDTVTDLWTTMLKPSSETTFFLPLVCLRASIACRQGYRSSVAHQTPGED